MNPHPQRKKDYGGDHERKRQNAVIDGMMAVMWLCSLVIVIAASSFIGLASILRTHRPNLGSLT